MNLDFRHYAIFLGMIVLVIIISLALRYRSKNQDVHDERLEYFKSKASAVRGMTIGCLFLEELPKALFIDKMRTRPMLALVALKLKAKALGMNVLILGYPGLLVGLLMDGDEVADVEFVGWGLINAPVIRRLHHAMAFKAVLKGWLFEHGLKVITVTGVYWVGSRRFTTGRGYSPINIAGSWVACDKETNYREIANMLNNSDYDD